MRAMHGLLVTHKRADVGQIEELCRPEPEEQMDALQGWDGVEGCVVLQTCNRAEFYATGPGAREALAGFADERGVPEGIRRTVGERDSARHLLRLAAGLESMVVGEDEILGQLRDAYHEARDTGYVDDTLETTLEKALHVGERVRDETRINEGNASMGSAAVDLVRRELDGLAGLRVVVVGVGEMGELVAKALVERDARYEDVRVANRTFERAERLADDVGGTPVRFADLGDELPDADVVVTATDAPHLIFDGDDLDGHELVVLDMANPRDVAEEADERDGIRRYDIDDVSDVCDASLASRREAIDRIEAIIDEELEVLERQFKREKAMEMLGSMYAEAEEVRDRETRRALATLDEDLTEEQRDVIEDLTQSIVNKLMATPTEALKQAAVSEDYDTLRSASEIFSVEAPEAPDRAEDSESSSEEQA